MHPEEPDFVPLKFSEMPQEEMVARSVAFQDLMSRRRSVRVMSRRPVPKECIERAIRTAASAPSGANQQPWRFVIVDDPDLKRELRKAAEFEERQNYDHRFPERWVNALSPLGTDWGKPFLEDAPVLIVVFKEAYGLSLEGEKVTHYYVNESVGIACGLFIAAVHSMGLATLPHTPSPMRFLTEILGRPANERPYVMFPVGFPADDARVPDLRRKPLEEVAVWHE